MPGEQLTFNGSVKTIKIGGNLNANIIINVLGGTGALASSGGTLGKLMVGRSILSGTTTTIANTLGLLQVNGDDQAGSVVTAGLIKKQKIKGLIQGTIS